MLLFFPKLKNDPYEPLGQQTENEYSCVHDLESQSGLEKTLLSEVLSDFKIMA